jgi:hypothetical protein
MKLSDRFSFGVPDMVYLNGPTTAWVEVKYVETRLVNYPVLPLTVGPQLMTLIKIGTYTSSVYLIYLKGVASSWTTPQGNTLPNVKHIWATFWKPSVIKGMLDGTVTVTLKPQSTEEAINAFEEVGATMLSHKGDYESIISFLDYLSGGKKR